MKNTISKFLLIALAGLLAGLGAAQAFTVGPLSTEEQAYFGATHAAKITYADLSTGTTPTNAVTLTNVVTVGTGAVVQVTLVRLNQVFDDGSTNTSSTILSVGDSAATNTFLPATELNVDGTEVFQRPGTNAPKYYTGNDYLKFIFSPSATTNGPDPLSSLTSGAVTIFYKVFPKPGP